ncbi:MAG: hypothetical protein AAF581_19370 [Planctomycetota bacterium]
MQSCAKVRVICVLCVLSLSSLVGCVGPGGIDIEGRDTKSFVPGFRFTKEFGKAHDDEFKWVGAVELDTVYAEGDSDFDVAAGESVQFNSGTVITGPANVDTEFDFFAVQVSVRGGFEVSNVLSLQGLFGVGGHHTRFQVENATVDRTQRLYSFGPHVGGRIGFTPVEWAELYGQVRTGGGAGESGYDIDVRDFEAGLRVLPTKHIALVGGWRWLRYEADGHGGDSDIEIRLSGPMVMLQIVF